MSDLLTAFGKVKFIVWPAYIGVCSAHLGTPPFALGEPSDDPNYERGQIDWREENGLILGRARIIVPQGVYTHFVYFQHPTARHITGATRMPHPLRMTHQRNVIDVDPITNEDYSLMEFEGGA